MPTSPVVEVFMTEEKALYSEWENTYFEQGSSSKGALLIAMPSARGLSNLMVGLSIRQIGEEEVNSEDVEVVYSKGPEEVESERVQNDEVVKPELAESHLRKGILLKTPKSKGILLT